MPKKSDMRYEHVHSNNKSVYSSLKSSIANTIKVKVLSVYSLKLYPNCQIML